MCVSFKKKITLLTKQRCSKFKAGFGVNGSITMILELNVIRKYLINCISNSYQIKLRMQFVTSVNDNLLKPEYPDLPFLFDHDLLKFWLEWSKGYLRYWKISSMARIIDASMFWNITTFRYFLCSIFYQWRILSYNMNKMNVTIIIDHRSTSIKHLSRVYLEL